MCLITILAVIISLLAGYAIGACEEALRDWVAKKKAIYQEAERIIKEREQAAAPAAEAPKPQQEAEPKRAKKQAKAVVAQVVDVQPPTPPQP